MNSNRLIIYGIVLIINIIFYVILSYIFFESEIDYIVCYFSGYIIGIFLSEVINNKI